MLRRLPFATLAAALLALPAIAQDAPPPPPDGGPGGRGRPPLDRATALAAVAPGFAHIDANGDGVVTRAEYDGYRAQRRAAMMARRQARDEGSLPPPPPADGMGPRGGGAAMLLNDPAWFDLADHGHAGRVTLADAQAGAAALFDRIDANHDGLIDPQERRAAMWGSHRGGEDRPPPPPPQ